ncbi:monovalent cation/H+ antiporter complex subunit F [Streptomyces sp. NPDC008317]|uniref:monovalent cation/H+ antiporter complex subunit F n=1 Tax=Streptomyces sp. NPDC008317 TaxID=3364827 RepID=UPI0036EA716D
MNWVTGVVLALLVASGVMVFVRLARGPSMLDRAVAVDALLAVVVAGLGARAAEARTPYTLPVLLVLAFLGFTGSVASARFIAVRGAEPPERPGGQEPAGSGSGEPEGPGRPVEPVEPEGAERPERPERTERTERTERPKRDDGREGTAADGEETGG